MRDLPNLDLLRACAVLSVVVEHTLLAMGMQRLGHWQVAWIGIVGVLLFFVHTSLVLMWSLERKPFTLDFYIRRVFRIYPLALAAFAAVVLFHAPVDGTPTDFFRYQPPYSISSTVGAALLIPNLLGPGYLPMGVMWSLPYEVEMYLVLPMLFAFVRHHAVRWPLLLLWVFAVVLGRQLFPFYIPNFVLCVPYFLPGVLAYVGFRRSRMRLPAWSFIVALVLMWTMFMVRPSFRAGYPLCLLTGLGLPFFRQIAWPPLLRASHVIAKYSYSIYLVHSFSLVLGIYLLPHRPLALQLAVIVSSLIVFSLAGYRLIEAPMIRLGSRVAAKVEARAVAQGALIPDRPLV